jgi:hypothetical protein
MQDELDSYMILLDIIIRGLRKNGAYRANDHYDMRRILQTIFQDLKKIINGEKCEKYEVDNLVSKNEKLLRQQIFYNLRN